MGQFVGRNIRESEIPQPLKVYLVDAQTAGNAELDYILQSLPKEDFMQHKFFSNSVLWTVPEGVSKIRVRVFGAGGGGGGSGKGGDTAACTTSAIGAQAIIEAYGSSVAGEKWKAGMTSGAGAGGSGGGGGGGGYAHGIFNVTPGETYQITVGKGGLGGNASSDGGNGGSSSLGTLITATGGKGGKGGDDGANGITSGHTNSYGNALGGLAVVPVGGQGGKGGDGGEGGIGVGGSYASTGGSGGKGGKGGNGEGIYVTTNGITANRVYGEPFNKHIPLLDVGDGGDAIGGGGGGGCAGEYGNGAAGGNHGVPGAASASVRNISGLQNRYGRYGGGGGGGVGVNENVNLSVEFDPMLGGNGAVDPGSFLLRTSIGCGGGGCGHGGSGAGGCSSASSWGEYTRDRDGIAYSAGGGNATSGRGLVLGNSGKSHGGKGANGKVGQFASPLCLGGGGSGRVASGNGVSIGAACDGGNGLVLIEW